MLMSTAYPEIPIVVHNTMLQATALLMAEERHAALCTVGRTKPCGECRDRRAAASDAVEEHYRTIADTMQPRQIAQEG